MAMFRDKNVVFMIFDLVWFLLFPYSEILAGETREYCTLETFSASCDVTEVIIMESALYGLMKPGRCVAKDVSHIGCQSDQLSYLDNLCSGQQNCELSISNNKEMQDNTPCPPGIAAYLEASYTCKKTLLVNRNTCNSPVQLSNGISTLSSVSSKQSNCGTTNRPLTIEAKPGQKINVTLEDFSRDSAGFNIQKLNCQRLYGHLVSYDSTDIIDICGKASRKTNIYVSNSHKMQIALDETVLEKYSFLITVEVSGCPDFAPPKNSWVRKDEKRMVIGCVSGPDTWEMKCVGNHWIGHVGNCTKAEAVESSTISVVREKFNGSHVLSIGIGCLAFVLCCITITVGVYFIKRYKTKMALQSTYGKLTPSSVPAPAVFTEVRSLPADSTSRCSTMFLQSRGAESQAPGYTLSSRGRPETLARQQPGFVDPNTGSDQNTGRITGQSQGSREYENLPGTVVRGDRESAMYYVLERPPGYSDSS